MLTLAERIAIAKDAGYSASQLARAAGVSSAAAAQWMTSTKTLKASSIVGLCELTGWSYKWWESGVGARLPPTVGSGSISASITAVTIPEQVVWGELMQTKKLPARFSVAMPDDSLAGKIERGTVLIFDTEVAPTPGHGVLLRDKDGAMYVRRYVHIRGAVWQAQATSDAYATMESERDGLTILAAMTGRLDGAI